MESPSRITLTLWAKRNREREEEFHPLCHHLLDVAQVTSLIWSERVSGSVRSRFAEELGLREPEAGTWIAYWSGLHDLGKASPAFQGKVARGRAQAESVGLEFPHPAGSAPHGTLTARELPPLLSQSDGCPAPLPSDLAQRLATAVGGHHGVFPRAEELLFADPRSAGGHRWSEVRREIVHLLAGALGLRNLTAPSGNPGNAFLFFLAGLTSVADWIGSNEAFFPFAADHEWNAYLALSRERARTALERLGWSGWTPAPESRTFLEVFPACAPARPLQAEAAAAAETLRPPALVLIEAPMGEGKTEAALFIADRLAQARGLAGFYLALPTQATSNQMFGRIVSYLGGRYPGQRLNLQLLHGHALLLDAFRDLRMAAVEDESREGTGHVVAEEWFLARKRGLLGPFGTGTIDQALLAVLQTRHGFVRLFGLAGKTVILDEVHAYDAYMSALIERLVAWLIGLGSTVVLLSATLAGESRRRLLAAAGAESAEPVPYPSVVVVENGETHVRSFSASSERTLGLTWQPREELLDLLAGVLSSNGCAVAICNTVAAAQQLYLELRRATGALPGSELLLFHARFPFAERSRIEGRVLDWFGKDGRRPERAVLVATQVVEQSLDIDFDVMVSELAPVDLLLQRAGRLHRHVRPSRPSPAPVLRLITPPADAQGIPDLGASARVYDRHLLLRSYLALREVGEVALPADLPRLIEEVYGAHWPGGLSAAWCQVLTETAARLQRTKEEHQLLAREALIGDPGLDDDLLEEFNQRLEEDAPEINPRLQALTRLGGPRVEAVCLHRRGERVYLDAAGQSELDLGRPPASLAECERLLGAALSISHPAVAGRLLATPVPTAWQKVALLRHHRAIEFDEAGLARLGPVTLRLDPETGLLIEWQRAPEGGS